MILLNEDCMQVMSRYEDKYFDLAIVDPPYGIWTDKKCTGFQREIVLDKKANKWDKRPSQKYFNQLFRISKNQIIWGMQYFAEFLPSFSQLIIWNKKTGKSFFADGEAAYCSIKGTLRIYTHQWCGAFRDSERGIRNTHSTQKPVALYKWLLSNYAKPDYKIIDTHLGSGSHAIAWHYFQKGGEFVGCEIDKEYFKTSKERIERETRQLEFEL
jgi:site-specific DNA-methyltransferase (adenine-specific)